MKKILRRLFCFHFWEMSGDPEDYLIAFKIGGVTPWRCTKCKKRKMKDDVWVPVNQLRD